MAEVAELNQNVEETSESLDRLLAVLVNSAEDTTSELEPLIAELEAAGTTMVAVNDALEEIAVG